MALLCSTCHSCNKIRKGEGVIFFLIPLPLYDFILEQWLVQLWESGKLQEVDSTTLSAHSQEITAQFRQKNSHTCRTTVAKVNTTIVTRAFLSKQLYVDIC